MDNFGEIIIDEPKMQHLLMLAKKPNDASERAIIADIDPVEFQKFMDYMGLNDDPDACGILEAAKKVRRKVAKKTVKKTASKLWTKGEINTLKRDFPKTDTKKLAKKLKRTLEAVRFQAKKRRLKKTRSYMQSLYKAVSKQTRSLQRKSSARKEI